MKYIKESFETDVLIVGGGLAGCMAAIKASESGLRVAIVEKANTNRSGCTASGIDHLWSYIPQIHEKMGYSLDDMVEDHAHTVSYGGFMRRDLLRLIAGTMYDRVLELEQYGLKFRFDDSKAPGNFRVVYQFHSVPDAFNFEGRDLKRKLTAQAKQRDVKIFNRIMITDLITKDGQVCGAVGINTREAKIVTFTAKAVVLSASGRISRLSPSYTGNNFNRRLPPSGSTGDGKIAALKAGAEVINMEFFGQRHTTFRNYTMAGGGPRNTMQPCARIVNAKGEVIVPRTKFYDWENLDNHKPLTWEERMEYVRNRQRDRDAAENALKSSRGPLYLDLAEGTDEEAAYVRWSMDHEGKMWLLNRHMDEIGVDLKKDKIEFALSDREMAGSSAAGIWVDENCESGIKNLFVAGDEIGGVPWAAGPGAVSTGYHAGMMAALRAKDTDSIEHNDEVADQLLERCMGFVERTSGDSSLDVELYLQTIMDAAYPNSLTSDELLTAGIREMEELISSSSMVASNPHEVMRCLEVQNLMDIGRLVMLSARERKESRGFLKKGDYPERDTENWFKFLAASLKGKDISFRHVPIDSKG